MAEGPRLLAVYSADLDAFGHAEGAESPTWDRCSPSSIGNGPASSRHKEVASTKNYFLLTSDHGMTPPDPLSAEDSLQQ